MNADEATTRYDADFQRVQGLTWLPWVGQNYPERPPHKRLLVVGESHYHLGDTPEERQANCEKWLKYSPLTRDVVSEQLVNHEWEHGNKTLDTIPKLLFKTVEIDHCRMWGDSAFYNFVQRSMDYNQDGQPERPRWDDYMVGWRVFAEVIRIIQPSHCLFIGVAAANSFNDWIANHNKITGNVMLTRKVGRTWARTGKLEEGGTTTELIFVQHLGKYFSWSKWHDYLQAQHTDFMNWLGAEYYAIN